MEYVDEDGKKKQPVVIHRAILGSLDRFVAFLLEETKGNLPLWLSAKQIVIIPVVAEKEEHAAYAKEVASILHQHHLRAACDMRNEKLGYRVRQAQIAKIPVELVVGDEEAANRSVTVRRYGSKEAMTMRLDDFLKTVQEEIDEKRIRRD